MKKSILLFSGIIFLTAAYSQPANDDPCNAISLTVQTGTLCTPTNAFSWTGATPTITPAVPAPTCASYTTGDIWWSFIAPLSGQVNINSTEGTGPGAITDGGMAVYYNPGLCSDPTYSQYSCDDDSGPGFMPALTLTGLLPGVKYYIRFWDFHGAVSGNIGGICVTDPNPPLATSGGVGIGIENPDKLLDVNGVVRIRGGNPGPGKLLTSDGQGVASWTSPPTPFDPVPFKYTKSTDAVYASGILYTLVFSAVEHDPNIVFSGSSFIAPATGIYHIEATIDWSITPVSGNSVLELGLSKNGSIIHITDMILPSLLGGIITQHISGDFQLTSGQFLSVNVYQTTGINQTILGNGFIKPSYIQGFRIK